MLFRSTGTQSQFLHRLPDKADNREQGDHAQDVDDVKHNRLRSEGDGSRSQPRAGMGAFPIKHPGSWQNPDPNETHTETAETLTRAVHPPAFQARRARRELLVPRHHQGAAAHLTRNPPRRGDYALGPARRLPVSHNGRIELRPVRSFGPLLMGTRQVPCPVAVLAKRRRRAP